MGHVEERDVIKHAARALIRSVQSRSCARSARLSVISWSTDYIRSVRSGSSQGSICCRKNQSCVPYEKKKNFGDKMHDTCRLNLALNIAIVTSSRECKDRLFIINILRKWIISLIAVIAERSMNFSRYIAGTNDRRRIKG